MTEAEIVQKFLARANPPPILFRYRRPSGRTVDEIVKQQIFAPKPDQLNDPFECSAPIILNLDLARREFIEQFAPTRGLPLDDAAKDFDSSADFEKESLLTQLRLRVTNTGIVCFSAKPNSIRMWSYYAQAHEGICVGYDAKIHPFNVAMEVKYQNPDCPFDVFACLEKDPTKIAAHISLRKAEEWKFEEEYRIPIGVGDNSRLISFHSSAIQEIRFGARIQIEFKAKVLEAISQLPHRPKLIQMGCDFDRFILTETVV